MGQFLQLRLSRGKGWGDELESVVIRVELPDGATEEQLRKAFVYARERAEAASRNAMDGAARLLETLIEPVEAR